MNEDSEALWVHAFQTYLCNRFAGGTVDMLQRHRTAHVFHITAIPKPLLVAISDDAIRVLANQGRVIDPSAFDGILELQGFLAGDERYPAPDPEPFLVTSAMV